jgi:hypothetical protein
VLDLMASWESHLPADHGLGEIVGLGLNEEELNANRLFGDHLVHDLNREPRLPFDDASFDAVICSLSVEYLTQPFEAFAEVARVLRPGGRFITTFSNRWFPPKVIRTWEQLHEFERLGPRLGVLLARRSLRSTRDLVGARPAAACARQVREPSSRERSGLRSMGTAQRVTRAMPRHFAVRQVNPYDGVLQVVADEDARAYSANGASGRSRPLQNDLTTPGAASARVRQAGSFLTLACGIPTTDCTRYRPTRCWISGPCRPRPSVLSHG